MSEIVPEPAAYDGKSSATPERWIIPAFVGGMFCALFVQYLAARGMALLGVPLTREVETGRVGE